MDMTSLDDITRRLIGIPPRRDLLRGLAAMALGFAATHLPAPVAARKKHSKNRQKKEDVNKLCKTQVEPCISLLTDLCGSDVVCKAVARKCCTFFGTCDVIGAQLCFIDALS